MITASHFNKQYNGFKFFYNGKKINKKIENKILSLNHSKFLEKNQKFYLQITIKSIFNISILDLKPFT